MFCKFMGHATLRLTNTDTSYNSDWIDTWITWYPAPPCFLVLQCNIDISCSPGLFENGWYHYTLFLDFKMQWNFPFYSFENGVPPKQTPVLDINSKLIQEALTWMRQNRNLQESNVGGMSLQAPYAPERQNGDSDFCNPAIIPTRNGKFDWLW